MCIKKIFSLGRKWILYSTFKNPWNDEKRFHLSYFYVLFLDKVPRPQRKYFLRYHFNRFSLFIRVFPFVFIKQSIAARWKIKIFICISCMPDNWNPNNLYCSASNSIRRVVHSGIFKLYFMIHIITEEILIWIWKVSFKLISTNNNIL